MDRSTAHGKVSRSSRCCPSVTAFKWGACRGLRPTGRVGEACFARDTEAVSESAPAGKLAFDFESYARRVHDGPCFVCAILAGDEGYEHPVLYEDSEAIAFLTRYPTLLGYCIVAPKRHVEALVQDLGVEEYLRLQRTVYRVAKAVSTAVPTERVYILSLGSQQGNAHVHWHVAPLPPGIPYEEQQYHALMAENGVIEVSPDEQEAVAADIRRELAMPGT
jgi:diadenosine tetraphosphate (Ap4A) HIT family hydrolase